MWEADTPGRGYLVAEALLEAHGDAVEQALPWGLAQLSLTVSQIGGHTVGPLVHFPGLGERERDTRQRGGQHLSF